jgi:hypothetical protein
MGVGGGWERLPGPRSVPGVNRRVPTLSCTSEAPGVQISDDLRPQAIDGPKKEGRILLDDGCGPSPPRGPATRGVVR